MARELTDDEKALNDELKKLCAPAIALTIKEFQEYSFIVNQINDPEVLKNQYFGKEPFVSLESLFLQLANRRLKPSVTQEVQNVLIELYPDSEPLTEEDFAMNKDAVKLVELVTGFDENDNPNDYELMNNLYEALSKRVIKKIDLNYLSNKRALIQIYEFKPNQAKALIETLLCGSFDYTEALYNCWDGEGNYRKSHLEKQLDSWVWYCKLVDEFIIYISDSFPTWSTMKRAEKDEYINKLKLSVVPSFIEKNPSLLAYINFLETYGIHQSTKAKAEYLLSLNVVNISTIQVAKQVTTGSQLV